jgi:hypothetical protein
VNSSRRATEGEFEGPQPISRGSYFWIRGYCVSTIGLHEEKKRRHVRRKKDKERLEESMKNRASISGRAKTIRSGSG